MDREWNGEDLLDGFRAGRQELPPQCPCCGSFFPKEHVCGATNIIRPTSHSTSGSTVFPSINGLTSSALATVRVSNAPA
jgi:hypothetical protein